jgi:transposase
LICDQRGNPLWFILTAGNVHDSAAFESCLTSFLERMEGMSWRKRLELLVADKGYDAKRIRIFCRRHGLTPMIPKRHDKQGNRPRNRGFNKEEYKKRNVVERCLLWLKECRRVATRYEKLAATYSAMVNMATIRRRLCKAVAA